ncbi:MAG: hypothetical protein BGO49_24630 [Planctomycetales bacterium 71-10]|nr:MAG: hypothetical protein BGO49_24630 [Planctomycetales bacterium 71-10]
MTTQNIEITKLSKSPLNARKTLTQSGIEDMKASILAHGLMQNLVVTEAGDGTYHVIAGARRLAALQQLQAEGKLTEDYAVPCQIASEEQAAELSLAENIVRSAMHPADEFEAFAALADKGRSAEEIALNFGVTAKHVEQRMKLARVAPSLLAAYRAGEMTLESLMAFTVTDDKKRQVKVWKGLSGWQKDSPREIRGILTENSIKGDSTLARFVGLEAYESAGGVIRRDLFGDDTYLDSPDLVRELASRKLEAAAEQLKADGWKWVETALERDWQFANQCEELEPVPLDAPKEWLDEKEKLQAEFDALDKHLDEMDSDSEEWDALSEKHEGVQDKLYELETKIEEYGVFTPEQKAMSGCYVTVGNGEVRIEMGLMKPEDSKEVGEPEKDVREARKSEAEAKPTGLSKPLIDDLKAYRLGAAQAEIAKHPQIAFDLLVFKAAKNCCGLSHAYDGPNVSFNANFGGPASSAAREFVAEQLKPIKDSLPLDWLELDNQQDQFAALQALTLEQKHAILAYCVASTLEPKLLPKAGPDDDRRTAYDIALAQTGANVAGYWRPTKDNYLGRLTKDQLLDLGAELLGQQWASHRRNSKKAALAEDLHQAFAGPKKHGKTPEQVERLTNWLPAGMEFGSLPQPEKPAKAKKARKAA